LIEGFADRYGMVGGSFIVVCEQLIVCVQYEFNPGPETSLFFSSTYVELYRTSTCCGREFFRACFKTRIRFRHTMVAGGFDPYHRLWRGGTQTKRTGALHTPWATPNALGLGSIHRGGEW
jgi:hypothetical protein